jgi:deoxyribodipyrimidine photo-lyase
MNESPVIIWFRQDLRTADNPAFTTALTRKQIIIPLYIYSADDSKWSPGSGSRWWLQQTLHKLDISLRTLGSRLIVRLGEADSVLEQVANEVKAKRVFYNRRYDPQGIREQTTVEQNLIRKGIALESFNGSLLYEPELIKNRKGEPFKVFTPFWNACRESMAPATPLPAPKSLPSPASWPSSERIRFDEDEMDTMNWKAHWAPGEDASKKLLRTFASKRVGNYKTDRDRPDIAGTSRLSPYLHFGEISPRQIWTRIQKFASGKDRVADKENASSYLRQLGWREFANYLLYHYPDTMDKPLRNKFANFPWKNNAKMFNAWREGRTGYPLVDAGMRELAQTGWMHNRVRMIAASFLVKHLLIPWQRGAEWFWDRLVDADAANNTLGWQWVAGCGADAAPFFRIFNPIIQGAKFDPQGLYVRKWIPELHKLPNRWIYCPWEAPSENLANAEVKLGRTYPYPIVDHGLARQRALKAYDEIRAKK